MLRENEIGLGTTVIGFSFAQVDTPRISKPSEVRYFNNQIKPNTNIFLDGVSLLVSTGNVTLGSGTLASPGIDLATAGPGMAVLTAAGPSTGSIKRFFQWMRRPGGSSETFTPLFGQKASTVFDLPPSSGAFEYRLDVVDENSATAVGAVTASVMVEDSVVPASYVLQAPSPLSGLVGEPSGPFSVTLQGSAPATPVTITPKCDHLGHFEPPQVILSAGLLSADFRFIPEEIATITISMTNDSALTNPDPMSFTATVPVGVPTEKPTEITPKPELFKPEPEPIGPGGGPEAATLVAPLTMPWSTAASQGPGGSSLSAPPRGRRS